MDFEVRPARTDDVAAIAVVAADALAFHHAARPDLFLAPDEAALAAYVLGQLQAAETRVLVAVREDQSVCGYAFVKVTRPPANPFRAAAVKVELDQIGVLGELRGKGVGSALMEELVTIASQEGAGSIDLTVWSFNEGATRLYQRHGFGIVRHHMRRDLGS